MYKLTVTTKDTDFLLSLAHETGGMICLSDDGTFYLLYSDPAHFYQAKSRLAKSQKDSDTLTY